MCLKPLSILLLSIILLATSCEESQDGPLEGEYSGEYYGRNPGHSDLRTSGKVTLRLDGEHFVSGGSADRFPAGGSGTYFTSGKYIMFKDTNVWTADFDWSLILNGKFGYKIRGDSLIMTRVNDPCPECSSIPNIGIYRLKRH